MTITATDWLTPLREERVDLMGVALDELLRRQRLPEADRDALRELIEGVWWSSRTAEDSLVQTAAVVTRAVTAVVGSDAGAPLALYVRLVCEAAWDLTWDHHPLLHLLAAAESAWAPRLDTVGHEERLAVGVMRALRDELTLESAVSTADLTVVVDRAVEMADSLERLAGEARALPGSELSTHLLDLIESRSRYAGATLLAARTVRDALTGAAPLGERGAAVLAELRSVEGSFGDHASASEIRAHRCAVESVLAATHRDWLRVDEGAIVCLFPFGLRHAEQTEVVEAVKRHGAGWSLAGAALDNDPTKLLLVDDCWRGDDPLNRRYDGTQLDLPDLELPELGSQPRAAAVSVLISQLGNHCLRVEIPLREAMPHEVAARIWMAAPEYGNLVELDRPLRFVDGTVDPDAAWPRLADVARAVLTDLAAALSADLDDVALSWRPGMFHVVTTVSQASRLPGGQEERAETLEDAREIPTLFGAQPLCHPLPAGLGSAAPWTRYESPLGTALHCAGLTDDLVLVTENHTLLASFSSADYMVATVAQAVEFVVDLEGMFAAWQDELSDFYLGLRTQLQKLDGADEDDHDLAELQEIVTELQMSQLRLRQFLTSARVNVLFIAAPALVTSPVMRRTVSELLELSPVWRQRADFTDNAGQALTDRFTDVIESWTRRKEDKLEKRNRRLVNTLLAVLAGIGISGVLAMVQEGFSVTGWGSAALVAVVLTLAAVVGVVSYRSEADRKERARSREEKERTGP